MAQGAIRDAFQVVAQDYVFDELLKFLRIRKRGRGFFEARFDFFEAGAAQARSCGPGIREFPGVHISNEIFGVGLGGDECVHTPQETAQVLAATALGAQPSARSKSAMQAAKQAVVIEYPVKRSGAEDAVEFLLEGHVQEVATDEFDATAEIRVEIGTGGVKHVLREVKCYDMSPRQSFQKITCETAGAAAGIEDGFISTE